MIDATHLLHSKILEKITLLNDTTYRLLNVIVTFLCRWYSAQKLKVRWENVHSNKFGMSNGVRQGGVLSPILFSIILHFLLVTLKQADIGCSWNAKFAGALAYADDYTSFIYLHQLQA